MRRVGAAGACRIESPCAGLIGVRGSHDNDGTLVLIHDNARLHTRAVNKVEGIKKSAYLGLATAATDSVNPDVLSLDGTSLVEGHVLHELFPASQYAFSSEPQSG